MSMSMNQIIKVFIAGSKELKSKREILRSVLSQEQSKWLQNGWEGAIDVRTFEDFSATLSVGGRQNDYNGFIAEEASLVVFVFDDKVGQITEKEFDVAYNSFLINRHPEILVYCNSTYGQSPEIFDLKHKVNKLGQYYIDFKDDDDLKNLFFRHMDEFLLRQLSLHQKMIKYDNISLNEKASDFFILGAQAGMVIFCGFGSTDEKNIETLSQYEDCLRIAKKYGLNKTMECLSYGIKDNFDRIMREEIEETIDPFLGAVFQFALFVPIRVTSVISKRPEIFNEKSFRAWGKSAFVPDPVIEDFLKGQYNALKTFFESYDKYARICHNCKHIIEKKDVCPYCGEK